MMHDVLHWVGFYYDLRKCTVLVALLQILFSAVTGTTWSVGMSGLIISPHGVQGWTEMKCRGWLGRIS